MITAVGIRRPEEKFKLGDRVRYHHRASEMRLIPSEVKSLPPYWKPTGPGRAEWFDPNWWLKEEEEFRASPGINKTLAIWPEEGSGIVISLIRRGIGQSVAHTTSFNGESHEPEPGYFDAREWVWLYVVKHSMSGLNDIALVPTDAIRKAR